MSRAKLFFGFIAVMLAGLAGGGWYFATRITDPMVKADIMIGKGDLRGAQVELRNALRVDPKSPEAHLRMARLQMKLADPVSAEREFRAARGLGADRWDVITALGESLIAQGMNRETLVQVPPNGPTPAIAGKNLLLRAVAQLGLQDVAGAEATLGTAEALAPGSVETSLIAARVAAARDNMALTVAKVEEVLRRDPTQVEALLMQEQLLTAKGDRAAALDFANRAVAAAPWSAMAHIRRANQLIFAGQDKKAQADVDAVLDVQPRFYDAIYLNGVLLARAGRYADAAIELVKLDSVVQRMPQALYYQGLVATRLGQTESAVDFARRYNRAVPQDPDGVRLLAQAELTAKRPERALPVLEQAVVNGQNDPETLDLLGSAYAAMGNTPAAVQAFGQAATLAPDDPNILTHFGLSQMQLGNPVNASTALERTIQLSPNQATASEALVAASLGVGDVDKAEATLKRLRAQLGETETVGILTGMTRLRQSDLNGARDAFAAVLQKFPNSMNAKLNLARVLIQQNRRQDAQTMLREVLAKEPANVPALNTYVGLMMQEKQLPPAIQAVEAARAADPKQLGFTVMLSDLFTMVGDPKRAVGLYPTLRSAGPLPPPLLAAQARAQVAAGLPDEAKVSYRALLKLTPGDLVSRGLLIDLLVQSKDLDGARIELRDALASAPGNYRVMSALLGLEGAVAGPEAALKLADALRQDPANMPLAAVLKGDALMRANRFKDAADSFGGEYTAAPSAALLMRLAVANVAQGQDDRAAGYLRDWLKEHPDTPDAAQTLAQLDIKAKRYADAEKHLAMVLEKRPNDPLALNNLAWTYSQTGDKRARDAAQKAYLQAPTSDAADTLGWIMVQQGDIKPALSLLQQSSKQRPDDAAVTYHLAVALERDGQRDAAVALLRPIVEGAAAFGEKAEARSLFEALSGKK